METFHHLSDRWPGAPDRWSGAPDLWSGAPAGAPYDSGFPFDLPVLSPFFRGQGGLLPRPDEFNSYAGFLDARIRYERLKALLDSVAGFEMAQIEGHGIISGDAVVREFIGGSTIKIPHNE